VIEAMIERMDEDAQEDFFGLIASSCVMMSKLMRSGNDFAVLGLGLTHSGEVKKFFGLSESEAEIEKSRETVRNSMIEKRESLNLQACCIALLEKSGTDLVLQLENRQGDAAQLRIPVQRMPAIENVIDQQIEEKGALHVFRGFQAGRNFV
jgi:hypothetical protein